MEAVILVLLQDYLVQDVDRIVIHRQPAYPGLEVDLIAIHHHMEACLDQDQEKLAIHLEQVCQGLALDTGITLDLGFQDQDQEHTAIPLEQGYLVQGLEAGTLHLVPDLVRTAIHPVRGFLEQTTIMDRIDLVTHTKLTAVITLTIQDHIPTTLDILTTPRYTTILNTCT